MQKSLEQSTDIPEDAKESRVSKFESAWIKQSPEQKVSSCSKNNEIEYRNKCLWDSFKC